MYVLGQFVGAILGAVLCYLTYFARFQANVRETGTTEGTAEEPVPTLGVFSTVPEIRNPVANLMTEVIATVGLVLPILALGLTEGLDESGTLVLIVALLVVGIGYSLGGPTGYALNPARDRN
ncbi:hypothetical protein GCM10010279_51160 [Streptomyces mutabilis]|nr:hypothetical protein GCM10010279_51160 [Streptomyces mutabilis]